MEKRQATIENLEATARSTFEHWVEAEVDGKRVSVTFSTRHGEQFDYIIGYDRATREEVAALLATAPDATIPSRFFAS